MNWITKFCQYTVGYLFVFSGLIKANDPLGFSYKLQEYFEEFSKYESLAFLFHFCSEIAVSLAIFLVIIEVVLGVAIIARYRPKLITLLLSGLIVFFTMLTFSSAYFGIVSSCGCFGDAIPLSPWQSFYKDIILLVFIFILTIQAFRDKLADISLGKLDIFYVVLGILFLGLLSIQLEWIFLVIFTTLLMAINMINRYYSGYVIIVSFILTFIFTLLCYLYLPCKDFRPYAKGDSITEGIKTAAELGLKPTEYANVYVMRDTTNGEEYQIYSSDYISKIKDNPNLVLSKVLDQTVVLKKGYEPSINDFSIEFEAEDMTQSVLSEEQVLLVISYDITLSNVDVQTELNQLTNRLAESGVMTLGLSASSFNEIDEFRHKYQIMYPFCYTDPVALKTIIRSNPGLVFLKEGVVVGKWSWRNIPSFKTLNNKYLLE